MVPITRSASDALEDILGIILAEPPPTSDFFTIRPFRVCFSKAGIFNGSDFISMEPNAYDSLSFGVTSFCDKDQQLNATQVRESQLPLLLVLPSLISYGFLFVWP
jgi:hypothetical protein